MKEKIKKEQEIEDFIQWLRYFYLSSPKQKNKTIKRVNKESKTFGNWLEQVRDFDIDMQESLIEQLRYAEW